MTSKLALYNRALSYLSTQRLADLTEDKTARYELDAVYAECRQEMLEKGLWKFALRTSELTADPDIDTSFGLPYAYVIPDDFVRLAGISTDDRFTNEDESYIEENGKWYSEHSRLYVRYVSNDNAYGFDLGKYPENYCSAFGAFMALRTALPITKDRGDRNDLVQLSEELLQTAKRLDAVDERVKRKPAGRWTRARGISTGPHFAGGRMGWRG